MERKTCLTVAGSDSGGGAGIQQDLKTFEALEVHGVSALTSLTAQNTGGVREIYDVTPEFLRAQLETLFGDFDISTAKTGMLHNSDIIEIVGSYIERADFVVDPVMVATSGDLLLKEEAIETLKERLLPEASLITPNIREAEVLTGKKITTLGEMEEAGLQLSSYAPVVVKGGHLKGTDVLCIEDKVYRLRGEPLKGEFHGSGCAFSASLAAHLAKGYSLKEAAEASKEYIQFLMKNAFTPGKGSKVLSPCYPLALEAEKMEVMRRLYSALEVIKSLKNLEKLIPEVGMNLGFSIKEPGGIGDVAALNGRIVKVRGRAFSAGCPEFGASTHVAKFIITAHGFHPPIRAGINMRYSPEIIEACRKAELSISSFDRMEEPPGVSTMEWGTARAIEEAKVFPEVVFDRGGKGKEAMARVLAPGPEEIAEKLARITDNYAEGQRL